MKTIHQNIDTDLQTLTGSTAPWGTCETDTKPIQAADTIYQSILKRYEQAKIWIAQTLIASLEGQIMIVDEMIREGSQLYPYNFTGSPQSLFLLPNSYGRNKKQPDTSLQAPNIGVERLDGNRYAVKFTRKTDDSILNMYDASGELIFTEQINQKGTFNLIYNLQWTGLSQVSIEVYGNNKFYQSDFI